MSIRSDLNSFRSIVPSAALTSSIEKNMVTVSLPRRRPSRLLMRSSVLSASSTVSRAGNGRSSEHITLLADGGVLKFKSCMPRLVVFDSIESSVKFSEARDDMLALVGATLAMRLSCSRYWLKPSRSKSTNFSASTSPSSSFWLFFWS